MRQKIYFFKSLFFLILLSIPIIIIGQNSDKNTITYTSPSKDFLDITIQSHKGLPRFGELYYHRGVTPPTNPIAYNVLIGMKYLTTIYADMDKSKLTSYENSKTNLKNANSALAQNHLKQLAGLVGSDALLEKYFCDKSTATKCTFIDAYGQRKRTNYWGGSNTNQFQQMRSYKSFINNNHLETLQNWSTTFFKDGSEIGYIVSRSSVVNPSSSIRSSKAYDFQKKGYWLGGVIAGGGHPIPILDFIPFTENERILKDRYSKIFLSISPEKAKKLSLIVRAPLFTVAKIKVHQNKKIPISNGRVSFSFELESPIIEVYKDQALTNKIGEISAKQLIYKK